MLPTNGKIMSIDQSLRSSGYTIWTTSDLLVAAGVLVPPKELEDQAEVLVWAIKAIYKLTKDFQIVHIVIEGLPFGMQSTSVRVLAALYYSIQMMALEVGIGFSSIAPTQVKKFATGNGKATKQEMLEALPEVVKTKLLAKYKKTKGLYDVTDSYWIYKTWKTLKGIDAN